MQVGREKGPKFTPKSDWWTKIVSLYAHGKITKRLFTKWQLQMENTKKREDKKNG